MIRSFKGKTPRIHPTAFISESCYIVGDVEIGQNSSVWPGAVIRGDYGRITIGKNTVIQDNCVIHTDDFLDIGDNVQVTHSVVIHGHYVGNNVIVGTHSTILESACIGSFCLIAANALVLANTQVPDNSLVVGVPGQVKALQPHHRRRLENPTELYLRNAREFKEAGLGDKSLPLSPGEQPS